MGIVQYVVRHPWRVALTVAAGVLLGLGAFYVYQVQAALGTVATEEFDPGAARAAIDVTDTTSRDIVFVEPAQYPEGEEPAVEDQLELAGEFDITGRFDPRALTPHSFGAPIDDEEFTSYLLVGADASGFLADVIILALQPSDDANPIMVSLPRDLFVWNLCQRTLTRLNEGLGGCTGVASGSELLAIMVEDYSGIPIDHVARVNFGGFARIVNAMGGVSICVDHPTRDANSALNITGSGCRKANGDTALAWVRSRHTEQLIDGKWVTVVGSDFARQTRQQDVLFQLAGKAAGFSSPVSLTKKLSAVASSVRLDSSWTFGQAVSAAWRYRGISKEDVSRFSIEVQNHRTPRGAAVLLPTMPFKDQLEEIYPLD
ncbi:MAG: LCP family protein [Actinomycetota bacterium]|nr:LCP family protein [Actinomycetota bacterium]